MVRYPFQEKFRENGADEKPMTNFWQRNRNAIPNCKICAAECVCTLTVLVLANTTLGFLDFSPGFLLGFCCLMFLLVTVYTVVANQGFLYWLLRTKHQLGFLGVVHV
jgi:hypothetical protein